MTDPKEKSQSNSVEYEKPNNAKDWTITSEVPSNITKDSERFKSVTVWIVCFVNLIYYADRFGIAGILTDIQCGLGANDAQAGLLQTAFIATYIIFAPIIGFMGDRYSRRWIMCAGMFVWSLSGLIASFMQELWAFILARSLLGFGEACFSSIAPAIISDLYAIDQNRSKYLACYYFTIPVGSGLGYIVFAAVSQAANDWRWGLRVTPIAGFISVLLIIFFLRDPPRGESEGSKLKATSWMEDLKYLGTHWSWINIAVASTAVAFLAGAFGAWGPKFITLGLITQQSENSEESDAVLNRVSLIFGIITVITGLLGVIIGAVMGAKLRPKFPTADPIICGWGVLAAVPLIYAMMLLARGPTGPTYTTFFFGQWLVNLNWSLATEMIMYSVVATRRSTAKAIQILLNHVLGDSGAPFAIGLLSEAIKPLLDDTSSREVKSVQLLDDQGSDCQGFNIDLATAQRDFTALQYALFIAIFVQVIGAFAFIATSWTIVADKAQVELVTSRGFDDNENSATEINTPLPTIIKFEST